MRGAINIIFSNSDLSTESTEKSSDGFIVILFLNALINSG